MAESLSLRALAAYAGILPGYTGMDGSYRATSDAARERVLAALGHPASDARMARQTLAALLDEARARLLPESRVVVAGAEARAVRVQLAGAPCAAIDWTLTLDLEEGASHAASGHALVEARGARSGVVAFDLPVDPPLGYHTLTVTIDGPGGTRAATQHLIVVPPRCLSAAEALRGERVVGVTASLYTVRSARNWGVGDLTDLGTLVDVVADHGGAFVGVNPLHALRTSGLEPSPYGPVSRVFRHLLYLDVDAVPELADDAAARALRAEPGLEVTLGALRAADRVDHAAVLAAKRPVLEALHRAFRRLPAEHARRRAYEAYVAEQGAALDRYATFQALDEHFRAEGFGWWPEWPEAMRDAAGDGVRAFAATHAEAVDFHRWTQFELDAQLAAAAARARARQLPVGLYQDLAVGASPAGGDVWGDQALFVTGVALGAPPDALGPDGQNWGLPPMSPRELARAGYAPWTRLVRSAMRHAGALRIDHAIGLFRQFWIPQGSTGRDGAYMRMPADDLLGILALESVRANGGAGALVVGEDLGTVPPEVGPGLARWGVLSSKVLYFERGEHGSFVPPRTYARAALATVNTHDLATLAGWWQGRDVALRRELDLATDEETDGRECGAGGRTCATRPTARRGGRGRSRGGRRRRAWRDPGRARGRHARGRRATRGGARGGAARAELDGRARAGGPGGGDGAGQPAGGGAGPIFELDPAATDVAGRGGGGSGGGASVRSGAVPPTMSDRLTVRLPASSTHANSCSPPVSRLVAVSWRHWLREVAVIAAGALAAQAWWSDRQDAERERDCLRQLGVDTREALQSNQAPAASASARPSVAPQPK